MEPPSIFSRNVFAPPLYFSFLLPITPHLGSGGGQATESWGICYAAKRNEHGAPSMEGTEQPSGQLKSRSTSREITPHADVSSSPGRSPTLSSHPTLANPVSGSHGLLAQSPERTPFVKGSSSSLANGDRWGLCYSSGSQVSTLQRWRRRMSEVWAGHLLRGARRERWCSDHRSKATSVLGESPTP